MSSLVFRPTSLKVKLFILILGTVQSCKVDDILRIDVKMANFSFLYSRKSTIFACASECLMRRLCSSFNFETATGLCVLNHRNSSTVTLTPAPGVIFSDISNWPQSLAGPCTEHICNKLKRCIPLRNKEIKCVGLELTQSKKDIAKVFRVMTGNKTWDVADKKCSNNGGQLLSFLNGDELGFLSSVLKNTAAVELWTGAVRIDGEWQWTDGRAVSDGYWADEQPITNGNCAFVRLGSGLMAGNCSKERPSMCERL